MSGLPTIDRVVINTTTDKETREKKLRAPPVASLVADCFLPSPFVPLALIFPRQVSK